MSDQMPYLNIIRRSDSSRKSMYKSSISPQSEQDLSQKSDMNRPVSIMYGHKPTDVKSRPEVLLTWESLNYTVLKKTRDLQVLNNVSGFANPRELLVIMGASGSGKSTLLNVLAKRAGGKKRNIKISGSIKANGCDVKDIKYRELVGYVTQDDILMETLTPRETLEFAASLRLSNNQEYNNARIDKLVKQLNLTKVQHMIIGGPLAKSLSGGERKRVSIASELITDPPLLFLDEPTSGLDSYTSDLLMNLLASQARKGHTIICTLHQPSYKMYMNFNRLILMMQGSIIYQASAKEASKYFKKIGFETPKLINPSDYFMDILHIKNKFSLSPSEQYNMDLFKTTYDANQDLVWSFKNTSALSLDSNQGIYHPSYLTQLKQTLIRSIKNAHRDKILTRVKIFQNIFLIVLLDLIFHDLSTDDQGIQSRNGILYYVMIPQTFLPMQIILMTCIIYSVPLEKNIYFRDRAENMYSLSCYFVSKSLSELPIQILTVIVFSAALYWPIGLNPLFYKFVIFTLVLFIMHEMGVSIGMIGGSIYGSVKTALAFGPYLISPLVLFGGMFVNIDSINAAFRWLVYISPFHYAFEALTVNEYTDQDLDCDCDPIDDLGHDEDMLGWDILIILCMAIFFRILAYLILSYKTYKYLQH